MRNNKWIVLLLFLAMNARAAVPSQINYQGLLTGSGGTALAAVPIAVEFRFYNGPAGALLHAESHTVTPQSGRFEVRLGTGTMLPGGSEVSLAAAIMTHDDIWMGITAGADPEMTPRLSLNSVAYALRAGDADTQGGQDVAALITTLQAQVSILQGQVEALQTSDTGQNTSISGLNTTVSGHTTSINSLNTTVSGHTTSLNTLNTTVGGHTTSISTLNTTVSGHTTSINTLNTNVTALQTKTASMTAGNDGGGYSSVFFTGVNLYVRNGLGGTDGDADATWNETPGAVNGLGNLIVGYNEIEAGDLRTGSHNLVTGASQYYSSYGGIVAGYDSRSSAIYASVSGGTGNIASGTYSSVSGGWTNTASGDRSSASGGVVSTASGSYSSVTGGRNNTASGSYASINGGGGLLSSEGNEVHADYGVISGGSGNTIPLGDDNAYICSGTNLSTGNVDEVLCNNTSWDCPPGMSWAGGWCIDNAVHTATTWGSAMINCYNDGGTICPMEALLSCDQMPVAYMFSDCETQLDTAGTTFWTSETTADAGSNWTTNIAVISGSNTVTGVSSGGSNPYWCCLPAYR